MSKPSQRIRVGDRVMIYPRGKCQLYVADFWHDDCHQRLSLRTRKRKVAIQRAVKLDADLTAGTFQSPPPPTAIRQVIEVYLDFLKTEGRARKTIVRYQGELHTFRDFLETLHVTRLAQITVERFEQFRARCKEQGHAPRTLYHESVVVKQFLRWCCRRHWLVTHPLADVKLGKPVMKPRGGPTLKQVNALLEAARGPRRLQYALLAFTGMRSGEGQRLRPDDVDLSGNWIHIESREGAETKTRRSRKVPIHPRVRALLETVPRTARPWFFTASPSNRYPDGTHWINPKKLNDDFVKLVTQLGMPAGRDGDGFTIHSLRHFFETFCVNAGIPQRVIDTWLGHGSDQSMAAKYYRLPDEESQAFMMKVPFGTGMPAADAGNHREG